jgi:hypothetical protein
MNEAITGNMFWLEKSAFHVVSNMSCGDMGNIAQMVNGRQCAFFRERLV